MSGLMGVTNAFAYNVSPQVSGTVRRQTETAPGARPAVSGGTDASVTENTVRGPQKSPGSIILDAVAEGEEQGKRVVRETLKLMQRAAGMETGGTQQKTAPEAGTADVSLVERIQQSVPQLQSMESVADVKGNELPSGGKLIDRLSQFAASFGNKVFRPGFGEVFFSRGKLKSSMIGHGMGGAKIETFPAVPAIIQQGRQIDFQPNWKGRNYDTYTFAAPVNYKGKRTYIGVIVAKDKQSSRYYLHEVVDEHGNVIFQNTEAPTAVQDGTSALSGDLDTVPAAGAVQMSPSDGRASLKGTVDTVETSGVEGTSSLNVDSTIPQGTENVNPSGGDGLGAADAGSLNSDYDRLQAQSAQFHPEGAGAARPVDVPKTDFAGRNVSKAASTVMGARMFGDADVARLEQMAADGAFSFDTIHDKDAVRKAQDTVRDTGFDRALERYMQAARANTATKGHMVPGQILMAEAARGGDRNALAEICALYARNSTSAQAMQAQRIFRQLGPEARL